MAGGGPSTPLDSSCWQEQPHWSRYRFLIRAAERPSPVGVSSPSPTRYPAFGLPELRMESLRAHAYGMVYG